MSTWYVMHNKMMCLIFFLNLVDAISNQTETTGGKPWSACDRDYTYDEVNFLFLTDGKISNFLCYRNEHLLFCHKIAVIPPF